MEKAFAMSGSSVIRSLAGLADMCSGVTWKSIRLGGGMSRTCLMSRGRMSVRNGFRRPWAKNYWGGTRSFSKPNSPTRPGWLPWRTRPEKGQTQVITGLMWHGRPGRVMYFLSWAGTLMLLQTLPDLTMI